MNSKQLLKFLMLGAAVWLLAGCGPTGDRCRKCGMVVDDHPRWVAGLIDERGVEERFCSPRCMFAHWRSPAGAAGKDAWVTEYYTQQRLPVPEVYFVMGSDVMGPMGRALVPVAGQAAAEGFLQDHRGTRILSPEEITAELLREVASGVTPDSATPTDIEDLH
jgi:copper chaperone NosL